MYNIKARIFALLIALAGFTLVWHSHYDAQHSDSYNLKEAAFSPLLVVAGIVLLFFPQYFGKPETTREKFVVLAIFAVGILLGMYNWHSVDPSRFQFLAGLMK